jgi:hypothetical protein
MVFFEKLNRIRSSSRYMIDNDPIDTLFSAHVVPDSRKKEEVGELRC